MFRFKSLFRLMKTYFNLTYNTQ